MRVGVDVYTLSGLDLTPLQMLQFAHEHGLNGLQFGSGASVSRTLDPGEIAEFRHEADRLGLAIELGIPQVNPHRLRRNPAVLGAGDGDERRGIERYIRAAHSAGCRELHSSIGHLGDRVPGRGQRVVHSDGKGGPLVEEYRGAGRLEVPTPWDEQIVDTIDFLRGLGALLRDLGCRINLETHADTTTFELVRIVEELGEDVQGITLDIANTMNQLEDPVAAAMRAGPYVHNTHTKDGLLFFDEKGLAWSPRACGDGVVPLEPILAILGQHAPDLMLAIEDHTWIYSLPIYDPAFLAYHADLTPVELAALVRLARRGQERIDAGETPEPREYERVPWLDHQALRIDRARDYLSALLCANGLAGADTDTDTGVRR